MRARGLILIGLSLILGFAILFIVQRGQAPPAPPPPQASTNTVGIVVAAAPLKFGDHLAPASLRLVQWPKDAVPSGAFKAVEDVAGKGEDRVALEAIATGEPILEGKVSGTGGRATLSSVISPNMRAVTLRVNDATGVAGFVLPNDRVDVLLTRSTQAGSRQTDILLQNAKVLAIDQVTQTPGGDKAQPDKPIVAKVVTLEVTPVDAEKLTLAQQIGTLSLALRNYASLHEVQDKGFSAENLLPTPPTHPTPPPVAAAQPEPPRPVPVTIIRGAGPAVQTSK
jgi:pilus assembly protein CpaB